MACAYCGTNCGGSCDVCRENPCSSCCNQPCLRWGFDDCFLRARCADGSELDPLNLCEWLHEHETCTEFKLVPVSGAGTDSYMEYINECGESYKMYVCDFLSLASINCLKDVEIVDAQSCDLMVFDPCCGSACGHGQGKWTNYHIPDAGDCVLSADANGYYHVLTKNDCGCIKECKIFITNTTWEYSLRDSWPDDPDWPFTMGSRTGNDTEIIDLLLDQKVDQFGISDLEVTVQYAYGIQNTQPINDGHYNFKSIVVPTKTPTHTPSVSDQISKSIVVQGCNLLPFGSWEWQVSRTFIVPKGQKLYLTHTIEQRDINANLIPFGGESSTPTADSSRLHALHVFVRTTKGVQK